MKRVFNLLGAAVLGTAVLLSLTERVRKQAASAGPAALFAGTKAGQVRDDNGLRMQLVWCPPGKFTMGSPKNEKGRWWTGEDEVNVTLTKGFWLGKYEVTQAQWKHVMHTEPWFGGHSAAVIMEGDEYPALYFSQKDALQFCQKLTMEERRAGRLPASWQYTLPTEAQWEYACRAGTTTRFSFGDDESKLVEYAWWGGVLLHSGRGKGRLARENYAHPVGQKKPNPWGLYDMHGNVLEFCRDLLPNPMHTYVPEQNSPGGVDPVVVDPHGSAAERGGAWCVLPYECRSASRFCGQGRSTYEGFRVALVQPGK